MSITTYQLTVDLLRPDGAVIANAPVTAELTKSDVSLTEGQISKVTLETATDSAGSATFNLWPNANGTRGSQYRIKAYDPDTGVKVIDATVTMPASNCYLRDILMVPAPSTVPYDEAAIAAIQANQILATQAAAEGLQHKLDAEAAKTAAQQAATETGADAQSAADNATAALAAKQDAEAAAQATAGDVLTTQNNAQAAADHRAHIDLVAAAVALDTSNAQQAAVDATAGAEAVAGAVASTQEDAQQANISRTSANESAIVSQRWAAESAAERIQTALLKDQAEQAASRAEFSESQALMHRNAIQGVAEAAVTTKTEAEDVMAEAEAVRGDILLARAGAEQARDESVAAAAAYADQLAQMANDIVATQNLILQYHG